MKKTNLDYKQNYLVKKGFTCTPKFGVTPKGGGFTLIELLVVISILSLMASIVLSATNNVRLAGRDSNRLSQLQQVQLALELYYSDYGQYPAVYTPISGGSHPVQGWDSEGQIFDNVATNWDGLLAVLQQGKYIARAEEITQTKMLAEKQKSNSSFINYLFSFISLTPDVYAYNTKIQDPSFPTKSYAYMPSSEENPPYQNYRIRAHLENANNPALKGAITGTFLTSDDTAENPPPDGQWYIGTGPQYAHLACTPLHGYYCVGPKRDTFAGFQPGKPVIYLYPTEIADISVEVYAKSIDESIPKYGDGWDVTAHPDGSIINHTDGLTYPYLFWEGKSEKPIVDRSKGFIIPTSNAIPFLTDSLSKLGLKQNEADEFIEYWAPRMTTQSPYVYVYFMPQTDYDKLIPMTVTPTPDTVIRVYMLFKPLSQIINVTPQTLSAKERKGFTVVEWGGDRSALR